MFKLLNEDKNSIIINDDYDMKSLFMKDLKELSKHVPTTSKVTTADVSTITANDKNLKKSVQLKNLLEGTQLTDSLHLKSVQKSPCNHGVCGGSIYMPDTKDVPPGELRPVGDLKNDATQFFIEYFQSLKKLNSEEHIRRLKDVFKEVDDTGFYELTKEELKFGAHLAWRNAPRCSGRIQWRKLKVFDCRHVKTPKEMFEACLEHIKYATNGGNIRSVVTIFPQKRERMNEFRVWNSQLIRYAGYRQPDGSFIGDSGNVAFTEICESMGWKGKRTNFDVLPWIFQAADQPPELFCLPEDLVLEVNIKHPKFPKLEELALKWYAVPTVSNMMLDCGGLQFTACPFNGWYNASEIGARNFVDKSRYNFVKPIAEAFGYNTSNMTTLWKDRTVVELTYAVINSFQEAGTTIVDHHSGSEQFMKHIKDEEKARGGCPTDWVWVVPPISGGLTPVFHQEFLNYTLRPSYEYQQDPWKYLPAAKKVFKKNSTERKSFKSVAQAVIFASSLMSRTMKQRKKATILYASETGRSETFSNTLKDLFSYTFNPRVMCMEDYDLNELANEECFMIIASTFGNGDCPDNGKAFEEKIHRMVEDLKTNHQVSNNGTKPFAKLRYSVFALGSKAYPNFCAFGHLMNKMLKLLGGEEIQAIGEGDELCGQEEAFETWASNVFKSACEKFSMKDVSMENAIHSMTDSHFEWKQDSFRLIESHDSPNDLYKALSILHHKKVTAAKCISVQNLQATNSGRVTNLVKIDRDTGSNSKITYQPGDHLTVFPSNEESLVNSLLGLIESAVDVNECVVMEHKKEDMWMETGKITFGCSIREMFTHFLDITTPPSQTLLSTFSDQCINEVDKKILLELAKESNRHDQWVGEDYPNVIEVLQQFPSIKCDVTILIHHLPVLKPRYYSISSSPNLNPNEVHITTSLVTYQVKDNNEHHGVCSQFLHDMKPGGLIPCYIKSAPSFHLPSTPSTPIIMIGPGTGIAPFRSFWQEAIYHKSKQNKPENDDRKMILYFGCRNSTDDIFREELVQAKQIGALTNVHTAYSRVPGMKKVYVQQLLENHWREIGELIVHKKAEIYVCGDVMMAADVWKTFVELVKDYCSLSNEEANEYISNLRETGHYHEDIFGTLHTTKPNKA